MPNPPADTRCAWARLESEIHYHDTEWGVPNRNEQHMFEMLTLEGAQAGLSWSTILAKREGYRRLFKGFDAAKVARFAERDVERLMGDASIVRNRLKIESAISNAKVIVGLHGQGESLSGLLWAFVDGTPIVNRYASLDELPSQTDLSKRISKDLKQRGFRFVGPTVIYAMMQAIGMVNDHTTSCPRWAACRTMR
ncbi:MAG: DNA-3-methyladenine glycosylase I [Planctomycetota bacterium]|nr:DNA-3-methyladenine glycosylase I [Planctomycetota bacterium]